MIAEMHLSPRGGDMSHIPADIPRAGLVIATILSMVTISVLAVFLTRRIQATRHWGRIPMTRWLILAIYSDSIVFIFVTSVLEHGLGLNSNMAICSAAILLCLSCYMTTKLIYYFLVEKVYIIRSVQTPRLQSKLYCFNCFGMLLPYCVVVLLNFVYRTAYFTPDGTCIIGMEMKALMPLIIFDAVVNFYLTLLFVVPLRSLYTYKNSPSSKLRTIALRSFIGSVATLTSSVVNLTVLMVLRGEAAWICLMCCNADILFSILVLQWVTSKDSANQGSSNQSALREIVRSKHSKVSNRLGDAAGTIGSKNLRRQNHGIDREGFGLLSEPECDLGKAEAGTVTTSIAAHEVKRDVSQDRDSKSINEEESDLERGRSRSSGRSGEARNLSVGRIQVQAECDVENESWPRTARSNEAELAVPSRFNLGQRLKLGQAPLSTEELFRQMGVL